MLTKSDLQNIKTLIDHSIDTRVPVIVEKIVDEHIEAQVPPIVERIVEKAIAEKIPPIVEKIVDSKLQRFADYMTEEFISLHDDIRKVANYTGMLEDKKRKKHKI